jgi:hypothetical protein
MVEKLAERKRREQSPPQTLGQYDAGDRVVSDEELFRELGQAIKRN